MPLLSDTLKIARLERRIRILNSLLRNADKQIHLYKQELKQVSESFSREYRLFLQTELNKKQALTPPNQSMK